MIEIWWWSEWIHEKDVVSVSKWHWRLGRKHPNSPSRSWTYDPLVTSPDALPLSYRRLVEASSLFPTLSFSFFLPVSSVLRTEEACLDPARGKRYCFVFLLLQEGKSERVNEEWPERTITYPDFKTGARCPRWLVKRHRLTSGIGQQRVRACLYFLFISFFWYLIPSYYSYSAFAVQLNWN